MKTSALSICAALAMASAAHASIVNGGFETPGTGGGTSSLYGVGGDIGGWTVLGSSSNAVLYLRNDYAEPNVLFPAHSGNYSVDLTGSGNTGPTDGVQQSVATTSGQRYSLKFWVGNVTGSGGGNTPFYTFSSDVELQINGVAAGLFSNANVTVGTVNWQQYSYAFTASGPMTQIAFLNRTNLGDSYLGLDDVSLTAGVPEPSTWAMMLVGFAGLAFTARRKVRLQAA